MTGKTDSLINVAEVAALARLELTPEETEAFQKDMESIVSYVDKLKELDVSGIEPTVHALDRVNIVREDKPEEPCTRETMLANAPATVNGELVSVPQVLPGEGMA